MKQRTMLAVIVIMMLLSTAVIAQSSGPDSSQQDIVESGAATGAPQPGGARQLTSLVWAVTGTARGGNYQLLCLAAPALRGSGCCCTYLPMTQRNVRP